MKTVKELIAELKKFPEDALTYAYEGEVVGIVVIDKYNRMHGFIYNKAHGPEKETEIFNKGE